MSNQCCAPVLIITFNRPNFTKRLIEKIREVKPLRLYVSSDAPRENNTDDIELVNRSRQFATEIDWDCEVKTLFQDKNLGTRFGPMTAITWFFEQEEEGIILEDDCIPNKSFFSFCTNLLKKYRNDPRIMHITGTNQQFGKKIGSASYYFSAFPSVWGWASWKRVWNLYDGKMTLFPEFEKEDLFNSLFNDPVVIEDLKQAFRQTYEDKNWAWDHQLGFAIAINNGLCIVPNVNLISNVGIKKNGVQQVDSVLANTQTFEIEETLSHPDFFIANKAADINQITWSYEDTTTDEKIKFKYKKFQKKTLFEKMKSRLLM